MPKENHITDVTTEELVVNTYGGRGLWRNSLLDEYLKFKKVVVELANL